MKVLIFAFLAVAVSAHSYSYSSYPSSSSYYPSTYGIGYGVGGYGDGYGAGYGSGYGYGGGYGSGVSYVLGGAGHSYGGSLGGQYATSYRPAVYQTARYSSQYPHGTGAAYVSRVPALTTLEGPVKVSYTQDISGIAGQSDYQTGTPVVFNFDALQGPAAPKSSGAYVKEVTNVYETGAHGGSVGVVPGSAAVKTVTRGFSQKDGQSELHTIPEVVGVSGIKQPVTTVVERTSAVSSHGLRSAQKSGVHALKTTGRQPQISITRDFSKVSGHSGIQAVKPEITRFDKVAAPFAAAPKPVSGSIQGTRVVQKTRAQVLRTNEQPQISFVQDFSKIQRQPGFEISKPEIRRTSPSFLGESGSIQRSGIQGVKSTGDQEQILFTREITKTTGQSQQLGIKPEIFTVGKIPASVAGVVTSQDTRGFGVGSLENASVRGQGGIVLSGVSGQSGHWSAGVKPSYVAGISRQTIQHSGGVRPAYGSGISQQFGHHTAGIRPAVVAFDKVSTGHVTTLPNPSSGYAHRAGAVHRIRPQTFSGVGGPQISFILGGAALHQPGGAALHQPGSRFVSYDKISAPRVPAAPKVPTGHSRVIGGVQKSRVGGFSTAAAPGHISFTRDFSRVSGHQISAVKPGIAGADKVRISAFPETIVSPGYQPGQRNTVTFDLAPRPVQKPVIGKRVFKTPVHPVVQQPVLTAIHDLTPIQGSITGSTNVEGDKSTFAAGPVTSIVDSNSADYKHNIASIQGQTTEKFINVPVDDQKSAIAFHATGIEPSGNIVLEKGSIVQQSPVGATPAVTSGRFGQTYRYTTAFRRSPFRSYYSSAYPGYSQVSGESPRYDFSHDRSLLYSYDSPYLVSPFAYSYTTGSKGYAQEPIS